MRKFIELSKDEKKHAIKHATNEAMKLAATGKLNINFKIIPGEGQHQIAELFEILEPIARSIAEEAFYPDKQDIIIKLWEPS